MPLPRRQVSCHPDKRWSGRLLFARAKELQVDAVRDNDWFVSDARERRLLGGRRRVRNDECGAAAEDGPDAAEESRRHEVANVPDHRDSRRYARNRRTELGAEAVAVRHGDRFLAQSTSEPDLLY